MKFKRLGLVVSLVFLLPVLALAEEQIKFPGGGLLQGAWLCPIMGGLGDGLSKSEKASTPK